MTHQQFRFPLLASILIASTLSVNAGAEDRPKIEIVPNIPHRGPINAVALSPVRNRVLSGGGEPQNGFLLAEDSAIKLWDAASGQLLRTFVRHTDAVSSLAFSPDGARFLSGSDDMTIKLWGRGERAALTHVQGAHRWGAVSGVIPGRYSCYLREQRWDSQIVARRDRAVVAQF